MEDLIMAKTLEELKEAINNVIAENDKGEITATALNAILQDMSDTLSELGGNKGEDNYIILASEMSEDGGFTLNAEDKEHNKKMYDKLFEKPIPISISMRAMGKNPEAPEGMFDVYDGVCYIMMSQILSESDNENLQEFIGTVVIWMQTEIGIIYLCNDGTIVLTDE